jgi:quercetin dioxygenase-like cupin family protein
MTTGYHLAQLLDDAATAIPAGSILSQTVHSAGGVKTILFIFAAGQELSEHTAAKTAILYFIEGQAELTLGADRHAAQAGTWVQMPPHLPHSIKATSRVVMLLTMIDA